jgi:transposase
MPPRYTEEFKSEAVKQVTKGGYGVVDVAQRLGVHPDSLKSWIAKYKDPESLVQYQANQASQAELRKLKAELRRVTEERDILKKAAAFFANNPG